MYTVVRRLPKMSRCFLQSSLSFLECNVCNASVSSYFYKLRHFELFSNFVRPDDVHDHWSISDAAVYFIELSFFLSTKLKDYRCHICKIFEKTELPERSVFPHTALHVEMITEVTLNVSILIHSYHLLSDVRKANDESLFLSQCKIILWVTFFARIL